LLTSVMVVWHNSLLSKWMFFISYAITLGFILQPKIRFIGYSLLTAAGNFVKIPMELFYWNNSKEVSGPRKFKFSKAIMLTLLPLLIVIIFFTIYRVANPMFANFTDDILKNIGDWINNILKHISLARILFIIAGIIILSAFLINRGYNVFAKEEQQFTDDITRKRKIIRWHYLPMGFKNEFLSGMILLVMMNIMLLALNAIDIKYIWISFQIPEGVSLKEMVHQGTEWLIVSIILSMIVLIWLFRANQNFYSKSKWLKILAIAWMLQNMVLTISLLIRNNMYVSWHALAYKRLGVYVFIALTFIGLLTMLIKIHRSKSFYFLLRVNAWAAYVIMSAVCLLNWDIVIAKYNVNFEKGAQLDTDFYLELSPKTLPIIYQNLDKIERQLATHTDGVMSYLEYNDPENFKTRLNYLRDRYLIANDTLSWKSYNKADAGAINYLKQNTK